MTIDSFTQGYIECALWSSVSDDDEGIQDSHSITDLAPTTLAEMIKDCQKFQKANDDDLDKACEARGHDMSYMGHDFWLSRVGHGTGFWDRGLGELGEKLHKAAESYGNVDLYVGDDGLIYQG